jgi:serine/threonine protein kinase
MLLESLGRALVRKGLKHLSNILMPWGNTLVEIAIDAWDDYARTARLAVVAPVESNLRLEVESLVREAPSAVRQQVDQVADQVAGDQPPEVRQALANYLAQVPAMIRRSLRRPSDPTGTTLPGGLHLRKGEDLVALLPPRPPRFKPGDRPLPGVDWVLEELLGVGGFGEVWKARHAQLKGLPPVALKFCLDDEAARALRNEAGVLDQVMQHGRHEGIVQLRQAYLGSETPCLEYEYVPGGDLAGLIQELHVKGRPAPEVAGKIMGRLAGIIGSVHEQQPPILHRDLKPANILVQKTPAGKLAFKVADFGIGHVTAREAIVTSTRGVDNRSSLLTTRVQGSYTPLYASPQQVRGDPPDPRDDVYSLGVIWYQLLTGDLGSGAPSGMQWARELSQRGMPQKQIDLLGSCFESSPSHRPANAAVLAGQLSTAAEPPPAQPPIPSPPALPAAVPVLDVLPVGPAAPEKQPRPAPPIAEVAPLPPPGPPGTPDAQEARRRGAAAAWWFAIAGMGNLVLTTLIVGATLPLDRSGMDFCASFGIGAIPLLPALFHFLAAMNLRSFGGRAMVIVAIVLGFLIAALSVLGIVGTLVGMTEEHGGTAFALFLAAMLEAAVAFANVFAAIRGIAVLNNTAVGWEFSRPDKPPAELKPLISMSLLLSLAGGLVGFFLLVLLISALSQGSHTAPAYHDKYKDDFKDLKSPYPEKFTK